MPRAESLLNELSPEAEIKKLRKELKQEKAMGHSTLAHSKTAEKVAVQKFLNKLNRNVVPIIKELDELRKYKIDTPIMGCSTVPKNGSALNQKVSEGIQKNQVEIEKIIKALADVERAILDQEWDNIYIKVEKSYMSKHSVAAATSLTQDQRKAIAANAAKTYYDLLGDIAAIERTPERVQMVWNIIHNLKNGLRMSGVAIK